MTKILKIEMTHLRVLGLFLEWLGELKNIIILIPVEYRFGIFFATFPRITLILFQVSELNGVTFGKTL